MFLMRNKTSMPTRENALPGRPDPNPTADTHFLFGRSLTCDYPEASEKVYFGLGCFWGAERKFWELGQDRVWITAVGYGAGFTPNPTYEEVCSGRTGHNELVLVVFDPQQTPFEVLLKTFWENHDPTQGMRQGNDVGTQYRSGIYPTTNAQHEMAVASKKLYGRKLAEAGFGDITTEIIEVPQFYFAEDYHQQYLAKVPGGYCGLGGTGVSCPVGLMGAAGTGKSPGEG